MVGLEAPAKGTLEPPVGSDLDGGGCLAALHGVSGPLNGGGELVVDFVVLFLTPLLDLPHTAVGVEPSSHCCWSRTPLTLLLELNFPHTAVGPSSHCCWR